MNQGLKLQEGAKYQWELCEYLNRDICQPEGFDVYGYPFELFHLDMERIGIVPKRAPAKIIDFQARMENKYIIDQSDENFLLLNHHFQFIMLIGRLANHQMIIIRITSAHLQATGTTHNNEKWQWYWIGTKNM